MKKLFLSMTVILLAVMIPLTASAATIEAVTKSGKSEATIGEIIEVRVKLDEKEVESMQFDLKYDNEKFKYVQESAKSDLNSTLSHEIEPGIVRVSVIDNKVDGKTDNEVTMEFEAKTPGKTANFSIVEGSVEVGKTSGKIEEKVKNPTVTIDTVFGITVENVGGVAPQYVSDNGQVITALPKTGESVKAKAVRSINGVYGALGNLKNVIPYAFQTSETTLSLADLKAEFGNNITTTVKDIAKTGDTVTVNGNTYTIVIYGDVNGDGKVTTYDALLAKKINLGKFTANEYAREAANVEKSNIDTTAMQKFILRLRKTATDTILDKFPVKAGGVVETEKVSSLNLSNLNTNVFAAEETIIATIKSTNSVVITEDMLNCIVLNAPEGADTSNLITYEETSAGSGEWNIKVTATVDGTYTIVPVVSGNNVINGEIKLDNIVVVVTSSKIESISASKSVTTGKRFESIVVAVLESATEGEELTKELVKSKAFKADGTNVASMLTVEPAKTEDGQVIPGQFNLVFTPTEAGTYTVKPIVVANGKELVDANPVNQEITVTASEDYTVSYIEVYNKGQKFETTETNPYVMKDGSELELTFKYFHDYKNGTKLEITKDNSPVLGEKMNLAYTDTASVLSANTVRLWNVNGQTVEYDANGNPTYNGDAHINTLKLASKSQVNGNVTMTVTWDKNGAKPVAVPIYLKVAEPEVTAIILDGNKYARNTTSTYELDLYTYDLGNESIMKADKTQYYTILDLSILNQFYNEANPTADGLNPIQNKQVKLSHASDIGANDLVIDQVGNATNTAIAKCCFNKDGNISTSADEQISAIGISYSVPTVPTLTDLVTGEGKIQIKYLDIIINVNVIRKEATRAASMFKAVRATEPICEHEKDEGTVVVEPTIEAVGSKEFKCTKCGKVIETVELPKLEKEDTNTNTNTDSNTNTNTDVSKDTNTNTNTNSGTNTNVNTNNNNTVVTKPGDEPKVCEHEIDQTDYINEPEATCTTSGVRKYKCTKCNEYVSPVDVRPIGHIYTNGTCVICGETEEIETSVEQTSESTDTPDENTTTPDETPAA